MSRRRAKVLTITLLCGLLVVGGGVWAMSPASLAMDWAVIGGGGGVISSASFTVNSTVGQAAIGPAGSAGYGLGAGYWYVVAMPVPPPVYRIYLSIILKGHP